jgi:hypothetical protein
VKTFECLTTDDRYSVAQLSWLFVSDLPRACELAKRDLLSDHHHVSVEVRENGRLVLALRRDAVLAETAGEAGAAPRSIPEQQPSRRWRFRNAAQRRQA